MPVNTRLAPAEVEYILKDSGSSVLFVDAEFAKNEAIMAAVPGNVKHIVFLDPPSTLPESAKHLGRLAQYEMLIAGPPENAMPEPAPVGGDDTFGLFFTGGTTGKPKGVMLTHIGVVTNAMGQVMLVPFSGESRYLHAAPMFHLADAQMVFAVTMACGTHVILPRFTPPDTLRAMQQHRVTAAVLVPVIAHVLPGYAQCVVLRSLCARNGRVRSEPDGSLASRQGHAAVSQRQFPTGVRLHGNVARHFFPGSRVSHSREPFQAVERGAPRALGRGPRG